MSNIRKLYRLLSPRQRQHAVLLLGGMLIGTVLETVSVGFVVPALTIITQVDISASYPGFQWVFELLGSPAQEQLIVPAIIALFGLYLLKTVFMAYLTWRQNVFVFGARAELSQRLFRGYLAMPWTFHLQRNSGQVINLLSNETNQFTTSALQPAFIFLTEALVLIGICALLVVVESMGALVIIGTLGIATWAVQRLIRRHVLRWGQDRQYHEGLRVQHLQQGLGAAKDIKVLGRESDFLEEYRKHNFSTARVVQLQNTFSQLPRFWMELLAMAGVTILVLVMVARGSPAAVVVPTLGLFAVAAFRLIPSINRVASALQSMTYASAVIDSLYRESELVEENRPRQANRFPSFNDEIVLEDISYRYVGANVDALREINLRIPKGCSIGFMGGSGAGKSTLVDVILGLLTPLQGRVKVDGVDIQTNLRGWQDLIGYVPQTIFLTDDTIRRNVAFGIQDEQIDDTQIHRAIKLAKLEDFVSTLSQGINTTVGERGLKLSGGQRQRIGIARALYHDPPVLILDEAANALDEAMAKAVMDSLKSLVGNKTLLIVAHHSSLIELCDFYCKLENGKVVIQGSRHQVI
ncbi:MAG: ABC transporter ATP-binding protein/permease [Nitrososphaera sp.]|nr:ABC transporter ATP-binding protein/permease [Nitrososphaera sp.]